MEAREQEKTINVEEITEETKDFAETHDITFNHVTEELIRHALTIAREELEVKELVEK